MPEGHEVDEATGERRGHHRYQGGGEVNPRAARFPFTIHADAHRFGSQDSCDHDGGQGGHNGGDKTAGTPPDNVDRSAQRNVAAAGLATYRTGRSPPGTCAGRYG